jgi:UPF0716 protein FxsA
VLFLAWPLLEIASFVIVGRQVGVLATVLLVLGTSILGAVLLRVQGFGVLRRIQADMDAGRNPGRDIAHGAMILVAGVLLLLPGFVSDLLGLLLFIPPIRDLGWRLIRRRLNVTSFTTFHAGFRRPTRDGTTIDLDEEEFHRSSRPDTPPPDRSRIPDRR